MTEENEAPPKIFQLCERARVETDALGALLILFQDMDGQACVSFSWDGSNACHAVAPKSLRQIADVMERQEKQPKGGSDGMH